ncbi:MAG TPA: exodeoxyribonuclease VII small subunit [Herpetosiphonaceae bacterium]
MPRKTATAGDATPSYEALMQRLQQVVERLETGELPLAEALALYEEGVTLSTRCQQLLDAAELRIQQLSVGVDGLTLTPWADE